MRSLDIFSMALAMLAVPIAAWLVGILSARNNFGVTAMLAVSAFAVALIQIGLLSDVVSSFIGVARTPQADILSLAPEFLGFLFVLGAFVSLLAWSATPVRGSAN